ncbi:iron-containing redox enzyme family protein [Saccharospirillum alexandrii]|uniref:iron-containing redox enzyme family protein n=1 Tax=Saccharospirillum alexandrii TaxID=2448477 RepID=UPI000FDC7BF7|nr:iron-containing redox enzyme family protein [Saccharospirillum alexandrii]
MTTTHQIDTGSTQSVTPPASASGTTSPDVQQVMRRLTRIWGDFEGRLRAVPIIADAHAGRIRLSDYRTLLKDHYAQVIEGSGWISRAASSVSRPYLEQRSLFLRHAVTEHRDYEMLARDYAACDGNPDDLADARKNLGSMALSAWMYHRASQPNPFDLLGAMFIIEGLGQWFARSFAEAVTASLSLNDAQTGFYRYHADHDPDHLAELEEVLGSGVLDIPGMADTLVETAAVTARLYLLQLEEVGHYG